MIKMNEEDFITKFYSCDNEEQFLKDVNHNLNCLQKVQNNWNELKKCTKETIEELEKNRCILSVFDKGALVSLRVVYKKMQELEQVENENLYN